MDLNSLIAECTAYDFKQMLEEKKPKSWLKSVSAFANGLGGSLFFGIDNDGIVKGLDDVQHICEYISSKIRDYMDPLPEVEMIPHDMDGLRILQLKVNVGHYTPYYYVGDGQRIAFEFASWISMEFKLYLIKEFQRLKEEELDFIINYDIKYRMGDELNEE
jgi:ATP-dependent DNA helicase RecG